jgi:hypothetical protein
MLHTHAMQTHVYTFHNAFGRKVEMGPVVTTKFRSQQIALAGNTAERDTQENFAHAATVKR